MNGLTVNQYNGIICKGLDTSYDRIISIGDIHGCLEKLRELMSELKPTRKDLFIFIGDYIDRGPDSPGVIQYLIEFGLEYNCVFLRGNHDSMFLSFLGLGGNYGDSFLMPQNGGSLTLKQYQVSKYAQKRTSLMKEIFLKDILEIIPASHLEFLKNTYNYIELDNCFYSHAGFDCTESSRLPAKDYDKQSEIDYTWSRGEFLEFDHLNKLNKWVVHGHTISKTGLPTIDSKTGKINVDSGCFKTGVLSAFVQFPNDISQTCFVITKDKDLKECVQQI